MVQKGFGAATLPGSGKITRQLAVGRANTVTKSRSQPAVKIDGLWFWPGTPEAIAAPGLDASPSVTQKGLMSSSIAERAPT